MNSPLLTSHAYTRLQQRGIPPWFVDLLLQHGKTRHDGHGALIKSVDKHVRRKLHEVLPHEQFVRAERWFDVYAVVSADASVITAAHRTKKRMH